MSAYISGWLERLLSPIVCRIIIAHEQAVNWTNKRCHFCNAPVAFEGAAYCAFCCAPLNAPPLQPEVAIPAPLPPVDGVERHTSGIHVALVESEIAKVQAAHAKAKALEPKETFTARLHAVMKPGERPLQAYLREMKPKDGTA